MAIYPVNNQSAVGGNLPGGAGQASDATEWSRVEPLVTPEKLKTRQLWGIPLVSSMADPITKKRAIMTDDILADMIKRSAAMLETDGGFSVLPVQHKVRLPFDRNEYLSMGFMQLPHRPVLAIQELAVTTATGASVYVVPTEWVAPGHLQVGQLFVVPLQPAFLSSGYVPSQSAGGAAFLSILGQKGWIPEFWQVTYTAGFDDGKLPIVINELIGCYAAIEALGMLAATHKTNSHSIGADGLSQSVSSPGPQVYKERIDMLTLKRDALLKKVKAWYALRIFTSNV